VTEPIGLSTSWNGPGVSADDLLDQHRDLGFVRLEAYAHFTADRLRTLAERAAARGMHIASLHGPCPMPSPPVGDWLASTTADERQRTVDAYKRTIDAAAEIGAQAVVVHLGNSGVASRQGALFDIISRQGRNSAEHVQLRDLAWREREERKHPHLDAAISSIRALGEHALDTGVRLGVECRDGYHEIPSLDEFQNVFDACDDLPVGYWHDAGHGAKLEYLGFLAHEQLLSTYGQRMVGMHIHDTRAGRDHLAPGTGTTDFAMLGRYLRPDTIRTMELNRSVAASDITWAIEFLESLAVFGIREGILIAS
jgi:sugar phosphate isomerase/epimerase